MNRWAARRCRHPLLALTILGTFTLMSFIAVAAREEAVFRVWVMVPTSDFYVLPVNPGFLEREQVMHWNPVSETLAPLREHFDVKNVLSAVDAYLAYEPVLSNGADTIALKVIFNQQELGLIPQRVVEETEAKQGKRVLLEISAQRPDDGYSPGQYFGNVQIIFDALRL
ncbi:CS1 type fimbrial major subunit [Pseudomonas canadensis]|uniref:CS1 type fimbrial major subunit n=1 Tax=Pseudomonas canadensis TaxID=915099 RepID=UPI0030CBBB6D